MSTFFVCFYCKSIIFIEIIFSLSSQNNPLRGIKIANRTQSYFAIREFHRLMENSFAVVDTSDKMIVIK